MSLAAPGAHENPFRITPNPRFVYAGQLDAAREGVRAAIGAGRDAAVLGEPGMGKTLLLRLLSEDCAGAEVRGAAAGPGFDPQPLLAPVADGRKLVILLDDAHALGPRELRRIWAATQERREVGGAASLVLAGRPRLEPVAAEAELALDWFCLSGLPEAETPALVRRRLAEAGQPEDAFSDEALAEVARRSRGAPRLVNLLCSNALFRAQCEQATQVALDHVRHAADALQLAAPPPPPEPPPAEPSRPPSTVIGVAGVAMGDAPARPRLGWRALASGAGLFFGGLLGLGLLVGWTEPPRSAGPAQAAMPPAAPVVRSERETTRASPTVLVHYSAYDRRGARMARRVADELAAKGFQVSGVQPVRALISSSSVRYFFDADRPLGVRALGAVVEALRSGGAAPARMQDLTHYRPQPAEGTIELWIGRGRTSVSRPVGWMGGREPDPWFLKRIEQRPTH